MDTASIFIKMAASLALATVKNPASKAKLRKAMAELVQTILFAYHDDQEFIDMMSAMDDGA